MQSRTFVSGFARAVTRSQAFRGSFRVVMFPNPFRVVLGLVLIAAAIAPQRGHAQLVTYSFGTAGSPTTAATVVAESLTASAFGGNLGTPAPASGAPIFSAGSGGSFFTASGWNAASPGTNFFEFTLAPEAGFAAFATGFSFGYRSTGSGPTGYSLRSSADSFISSLSVGALLNDSVWHATGNLAISLATFNEPTTFRLYGYGATGSSGTFRLDDVSVAGSMSAIPEPSTYAALFGLMALGVAAVRKHRRTET